MVSGRSKPNTTAAATKLRALIWESKEGDFLGSEDEMIEKLLVSRPTVRQVARLLETEGLLRVKRGTNGGYFAARPSVEVIEASVSSYLHMVVVDAEEVTEVASALWVIMMRKAAGLQTNEAKELTEKLCAKVHAVKGDVGFEDIVAIEDQVREGFFKLVNSPYIDLIFHINRIFSSKHFPIMPADRDNTPEHREFVKAWRKAKLLELEAIADGDEEMSQLAARLSRKLFQQRIWGHTKTRNASLEKK